MKERPILWSPRMVRAIRNTVPGSDPPTAIDPRMPFKAETRRVVKGRGYRLGDGFKERMRMLPSFCKRGKLDPSDMSCIFHSPSCRAYLATSPAVPGDHLWGRETFAVPELFDSDKPRDFDMGLGTWYKADDDQPNPIDATRGRWRPGIFMPRVYSRILHEVTSIRLEPLQDISAASVPLEGFELTPGRDPVEQFAAGWDTINGKRERCAWVDNPWVWVIRLRRGL